MISVIVPIYEVEQYLPRCVDSIINQTYKDIEIILINDGSPDRCGQMCDEYAQEDTRVRVVHKANGGLSDARNAGLEIAKGEYVTFIDSDDFVAPNMLEHLLDKLVKHDADISQCLYINITEGATENSIKKEPEKEVVLTGIEAMEDFFTKQKHVNGYAWAKLYKISLFKDTDVRYPIGRIFEDIAILYMLLFGARRVVLSSHKLYYYLIRSDSITEKPFSKRGLDKILAAQESMQFIESHYPALTKHAHSHFIKCSLSCAKVALQAPNYSDWIDTIREIKKDIFNADRNPFLNRYLSNRLRFELTLLKMSPSLYVIIYRAYLRLKSKAVKTTSRR